jgi:hypothetical protein
MSSRRKATIALTMSTMNRFSALHFLTESGRPRCSIPTKIEAAFSMSKEAGRVLLYVAVRCT